MPLFKYVCRDCQNESEILVRSDEIPLCPQCDSEKLTKQLSAITPLSGGTPEPAMVGASCGADGVCPMSGGPCMN